MRRAYIELHIAVILFGFTAILGKLIALPTISLVWWRVLITSISLIFLVGSLRALMQMPRKHILQFFLIGVILALHWLTFFGSIKAANASVALVTFATASFFTALLEPLILRQKALGLEILLGLLIIPAMILIVQGIDTHMLTGIWLGLISAILASIMAILNKLWISNAQPVVITFLELSSAWVFISLFLLLASIPGLHDLAIVRSLDLTVHLPVGMDWVYLLILSLLCTTLGFVLAVRALRHLSAFATNLVINLEPIYGILMALAFLGEDKDITAGFYGGMLLILSLVFLYPILKRRRQKEAASLTR